MFKKKKKKRQAMTRREDIKSAIKEWEDDVYNKYKDSDYVDIHYLILLQNDILLLCNKLSNEESGYIERILQGTAYRIVYNDLHYSQRQRFTIAHELGHYVLHRDILGDGTNDTKMYRTNPNSSHYNPNISTRHEQEANEFASRILMPQKFIDKLLGERKVKLSDVITTNRKDRRDRKIINPDIIEYMADKLWVSEPALIVRLCRKDLDDLRGKEGFHDPEKITT